MFPRAWRDGVGIPGGRTSGVSDRAGPDAGSKEAREAQKAPDPAICSHLWPRETGAQSPARSLSHIIFDDGWCISTILEK